MKSQIIRAQRARRGNTLIEVLIALSLLSVVILSGMSLIESGSRFSRSTLEMSAVEDLSQQMLFRVERELANADGHEPMGTLSATYSAGDTGPIMIGGTLGFPPQGILILDPGLGNMERISYDALNVNQIQFDQIGRGIQGTTTQNHIDNVSEVWWNGLALVINNQTNPPASAFDGQSLEDGVPTFFRGDGTGFSYRIPVDPAGGNNYMNGDDLFWGCTLQGIGTVIGGRMALVFQEEGTITEAEVNEDLNGDGDSIDVFDLGQVQRLSWDPNDLSQVDRLGLGPSNVLQEQLNWGGDLDGDGFDDPIFLWDADDKLLHIRLFLIGTSKELPVVREVESVSFLRNEPEPEL